MAVKAPPPPAPVYSWTGWYVGVNGGYGWGNTSGDVREFDPDTGIFVNTEFKINQFASSFDQNGGRRPKSVLRWEQGPSTCSTT